MCVLEWNECRIIVIGWKNRREVQNISNESKWNYIIGFDAQKEWQFALNLNENQ